MYEINDEYLCDERINLNIQLSQPILIIGDACLALQASKVAALAELDFVQSVSEYEDMVCLDADNNANKQNALPNKITAGLFTLLDLIPDETVIKVSVLFANPATYEKDVETAIAELFRAY